MLGRLAVWGLVLVALGCGEHAAYVCEVDSQCVLGGMSGTCEPEGFCAFPDPKCPTGERFESGAGSGLGGQCVGSAPSCGAMGGPCCTSGAACGDNLFCSANTCQQCITDVALGLRHTCYLKYDHTVWCSGQDDQGQLGNGAVSQIPTATPVQVRDTNGALIQDATAIGAGTSVSCAIRANGTPWCWGDNDSCDGGGQLGDGTTDSNDEAVQVTRADGRTFTNVAQIKGEYCRTCARDSAGGVWCWGQPGNDQIGDGTGMQQLAAVPVLQSVGGAPFAGAVDLSLNGPFACVLDQGGNVWCWGDNTAGSIGIGNTTNQPVPVKVLAAKAVAAGRGQACAIKPDGTMWCWGENTHGRIGNGLGDRDNDNNPMQFIPSPTAVLQSLGGPPFQTVASIAAGAETCAVTMTGDAYGWGVDLYGQTGTGTGTYVPMPVLLADGTPLHQVSRLVAGFTRVCAFLSNGGLDCWGRNSEGELGDGTFVNRGVATPIHLTCP